SRAAVEYVVAGQPAKDIALIGRRSDRREPENTAPVVDDVEVASRILAEGRWIVDRPGIDRQLRAAVSGGPHASIAAHPAGVHLKRLVNGCPGMESSKESCPYNSCPAAR